MELDKTIYMADLFSIYKSLLTEKQISVCTEFYINNLGLSEIAENLGVTRQAVMDTINKVNLQLTDFEKKLKLKNKFAEILNITKDEKLKDKIIDILNR